MKQEGEFVVIGKLEPDSEIPRNEMTTIGRFNQIKSVMGLLKCRSGDNDDTLKRMRRHMEIISTKAFVDKEGNVVVKRSAPLDAIKEFLKKGETND